LFTSRRTSSSTRRRSVRLSSIAEDSRLRPPVGVWTVLSSIGGGQPLSSPRRHSLGKPLPYQLADIPQAVPRAINLYSFETIWNYLLFREAMPDSWVRTYVLLPRLPVILADPLDLHALSTPPAFILS